MQRLVRKITSSILGWLALQAPVLRAADVGVGVMVAGQPSLSVQVARNQQEAFHFGGSWADERAGMRGDYQRLFTPWFGYTTAGTLRVYSGAGLAGQSNPESEAREDWFLRFPLGLQFDTRSLNISLFAEGAAMAGPIPATPLNMAAAAGLRARF